VIARPGAATIAPALALGCAAAVHVVAAVRAPGQIATLGESHLAAAAFAARGAEFGEVPLAGVDRFAAHQLGVMETLLPTSGVPVVDAARWAMLAVGLLTATLIWPVMARLGAGSIPTAAAVVIAGVLPTAVVLHAGIGPGGIAAFWLIASAALAGQARRGTLPAIAAALVAAITAPLAGAALLALACHLVASRTALRGLGTAARVVVSVVFGAGALALAVAATGTGPLAGAGGPALTLSVSIAWAAVGGVVLALAWARVAWMRALLTPTALMLAALLVPGPGQATAALIALPLVAVTAGAVFEYAAGTARSATRPVARWVPLAATPAVLAVALVAGLLPTSRQVTEVSTSLVAWIDTELAPGTVLRADALDRAELVADGVPSARLRDSAAPTAPGDVVVVTDRPTDGLRPDPTPFSCVEVAVLADLPRGSGGAPAVVCSTDVAGAREVEAEQPRRARLGEQLVGNSSLTLSAGAAQLLRSGAVDARVVLVLAAIAGTHRLTVGDFPAAPLDPQDAPRRRMVIAEVDGATATGAPLGLLSNWLGTQQAPFAPTEVRPVGAGLVVGFPTPSPGGLLPE
jgi:hypothetical protein